MGTGQMCKNLLPSPFVTSECINENTNDYTSTTNLFLGGNFSEITNWNGLEGKITIMEEGKSVDRSMVQKRAYRRREERGKMGMGVLSCTNSITRFVLQLLLSIPDGLRCHPGVRQRGCVCVCCGTSSAQQWSGDNSSI